MKHVILWLLFVGLASAASAQCRVYSGKYSSGGSPVGYVDGNRVYAGKYSSGGTPVGYGNGCGQTTIAAAALLLLL